MTYGWSVERVMRAYGDYMMPRVKAVRPKGYEKPRERDEDPKFQAWLRVVTEPRYAGFEYDVRRYYTGEGVRTEAVVEFEAILAISLAWRPFTPCVVDGVPDKIDLRGALIPVSAATIYAGVSQSTISRWIDRGLKHEKRGAYYWVVVSDLERFFGMKRRHKVAKHRKSRATIADKVA